MMDEDGMNQRGSGRGWSASPANVVLFGFLAIGGFYLIAEHWAHVLGAAPLLLLLGLCVGLHAFMHGGHRGHGQDRDEDAGTEAKGRKPPDHQH